MLAARGAAAAATQPAAASAASGDPGGAAGGRRRLRRAAGWSNGPAIDEHFKKRVEDVQRGRPGRSRSICSFCPYDQYWQKIDLAYASNQPYDIYYWDIQAYGHYKRDLLLNVQHVAERKPADSAIASTYPVDLYEPWKFDGANLYGVPENLQIMVLYYNKDICLTKPGLSIRLTAWTWDDMQCGGDPAHSARRRQRHPVGHGYGRAVDLVGPADAFLGAERRVLRQRASSRPSSR